MVVGTILGFACIIMFYVNLALADTSTDWLRPHSSLGRGRRMQEGCGTLFGHLREGYGAEGAGAAGGVAAHAYERP